MMETSCFSIFFKTYYEYYVKGGRMKKHLLQVVLCTGLLISFSQTASAQWVNALGAIGGSVTSFAVSGSHLFIGNSGVWVLKIGIPPVGSCAYNIVNGGVFLYPPVDTYGTIITYNNGTSTSTSTNYWSWVFSSGYSVNALAVSGSNIFAGANGYPGGGGVRGGYGVFLSTI
jgi:hypothetical protein